MENERPQEPLNNEQIWGIPEDEMPDVEDDRAIEEMLMEHEQDSILFDDTPAGGRDQ